MYLRTYVLRIYDSPIHVEVFIHVNCKIQDLVYTLQLTKMLGVKMSCTVFAPMLCMYVFCSETVLLLSLKKL